MKPRTRQHLQRAERNARLAQEFAARQPPEDWAVVFAFYACVHYVGAYLWEIIEYSPKDHTDRAAVIWRTATLSPVAPVYRSLYDYAYKVRYYPDVRLAPQPIENAMGDMAQIRQVVRNELGIQ